jgi:hypothetical protein
MTVKHSLIVLSAALLINCHHNTTQPLHMNNTATIPNNSKSFTATIMVSKSDLEAFNAIKNFRGWWSEEIEGSTDKLNEIFFYHYKDIHLCKMKLIEAVPGKKLVYQVMENEFNFIKDQSEWVNTKLIFDIIKKENVTEIRFTHEGLVPAYECYQVCNDAWSGYINNSLKNFIEHGKGKPNPKDKDGFNAELAKKWGLN